MPALVFGGWGAMARWAVKCRPLRMEDRKKADKVASVVEADDIYAALVRLLFLAGSRTAAVDRGDLFDLDALILTVERTDD